MLRATEIHKLGAQITPASLREKLAEDSWRLTHNFYGHCFRPDPHESLVVLVGVRSALDAAYFLSRRQAIELLILEPNTDLRESFANIEESLHREHRASAIRVAPTMAALVDLINNRSIDLLRIDESLATSSTIQRLIINHNTKRVSGEFSSDQIDPLELHRICRRHCDSFHWQSRDLKHPVSGSRGNYAYEVSVVVPCYKVLPWIDRCIDSLANQTLKSLEIIAVDDGSPDATGERLEHWAEQYPGRVKVVHKENGGCASARNAGLAIAAGEFVTFVDADDWTDTSMLEQLYRAAVLSSADVSQCGYAEVFEDSGRIDYYPTAWGGDEQYGTCGITRDISSYLTVKPSIWRRLYRTSFLSSNSIDFNERLRRFDDLPFQFEVFSRLDKMAIIPDCFYFYRQEREGQDVAVRDERLFVHFPIFEILDDRVMKWANADIEKKLIQCKINTHRWATSRIESKFRTAYFRHAAYDITEYLVHLKYTDLLKLAFKLGAGSFLFLLKCLLWKLLPRPKMIPVR